jgi:hypothetical protein
MISRSFELAPFTKILYSSDALSPAELLYLGARLWRNAITKVVSEWIDDDDCSETDATRPCGFRCLSWTTIRAALIRSFGGRRRAIRRSSNHPPRVAVNWTGRG